MNLKMVSEITEKEMKIYTVPILEGSYTAAALLEVDAPLAAIEEQLEKIKIEKIKRNNLSVLANYFSSNLTNSFTNGTKKAFFSAFKSQIMIKYEYEYRVEN